MVNPKKDEAIGQPDKKLFQKKDRTSPDIDLIVQYYNWCGVFIPDDLLKQHINGKSKQLVLWQIEGNLVLKRERLTEFTLLETEQNPVFNYERVIIVHLQLKKAKQQAPALPALHEKINEMSTDKPTVRPLHLISTAIDTAVLDQLNSNEVFRSISASAVVRLLLMEQYLPNGREQLLAPAGENTGYTNHYFLYSSPGTQKLLEKLAVCWGGLFGSDWILNGAYPAGSGFGQYSPGYATLTQLWVLHLYRCNFMSFPEQGKLILLAHQLTRLTQDERFIRHSSTLCGRLLLIRAASGQTLTVQRNLLETECRDICRAKDSDYHLLQIALKRYADKAGIYWLNTGKGMPGGLFLSALLRGTDWLSETDMLLHRELVRYPELPFSPITPANVLNAERYCAGCGAPLYGAKQKKFCNTACQQRSNRRLKKEPEPQTKKPVQPILNRDAYTEEPEETTQEIPSSPEFLKLVTDLLLTPNPKNSLLSKLDAMLRKHGQDELADMLANEEQRKTILQSLYKQFGD
jgi:hypothetical protein